jgi:hypothetical protein
MTLDKPTIAFLAGLLFILVGFLVGLRQIVEVAFGKIVAKTQGNPAQRLAPGQVLLIGVLFVIGAGFTYPFVSDLYRGTKQIEAIYVGADGAVSIPFGAKLVGGGREHSLELQAAGQFPGSALIVHKNPNGSYKSSELLVETKNGSPPWK